MEAMTRAADEHLAGNVAPAAAGDDAAFGRIVAAYHDDMSRVCGFVMRDDTLGEDAAQAAWSIAWRKLGSLREPERLRSWLMRIAVNEAKKLMKDRKRRALVEGPADPARVVGGVDPSTGIDSIDALAAVDRLGPDDRALLVMRYVLGFDATELAAATGKSPAATRQRLKRLLDRLRQELD
jgi:RNA polymerase sigma-70 factor (ECF subfamily)